jgi:hypothetical protein
MGHPSRIEVRIPRPGVAVVSGTARLALRGELDLAAFA